MDPDEALSQLRVFAQAVLTGDHETAAWYMDAAKHFAEQFGKLDLWLSGRGGLPTAWSK